MFVIFDKLIAFFVNIIKAIKFAAYDYDAKLRMTKTSQQRPIIWAVIFLIAILILILFIIVLRTIFRQIYLLIYTPFSK